MKNVSQLTFAQNIKLKLLYPYLTKKQNILDLGCGNMWLTNTLRAKGYKCIGFALDPPADILGDVKKYPFKRHTYDVVIALEMIEHVDCFKEIFKILKPNGYLIVSAPMPHFDWICYLGEKLGIFQERVTPHSNLFYLEEIPLSIVYKRTIFGIVQFGVFKKTK